MKKIFTALFLILMAFFAFADHVTKQEAQLVAEKFFANKSSKKLSDIQMKDIFEHKYNEETSFYVFTFDKGGFVIVSADDFAYPVLAYSTTSKAPEKIENPSTIMYLERYKKQIDKVKELKSTSQEIQKLWEDYKNGIFPKSTKAVAPLLTTTWNQSPYYNQLCPIGTPTGCVATAMSQIMNYHEWPISGNGWHKYIPSDNPSYGEQYADFQATIYDWTNMPNALTSESSATERNAVSTLNYHAGISVNMNYDPSGSGAQSTDVLFALTSYFKYNPYSIQIYDFDVANISTWLTLAKNELDNGRPIYYDGSSVADGGHAWVCDGYDNTDNLHINWGWGGAYNGYFTATAMTPESYNFSEYNSMIIGIMPGVAIQDMQWVKQASGFITTSRGIQNISALDSKTAWAIAYDGSGDDSAVKDFTRTIDGGATWVSGTINTENTTDFSAAMISAIDENIAWVALFGPSGGGKIVKTTDGGTTWMHQSTATFTAPNGFPNVVHFWDANNGFCMGDPNGGYFEIYTTTNGGDTWTRVPQGNIPANSTGEYGTVGYYAVYGDIVWFATNKGRIFKSTDKGINWVAYQTPISSASFELSFKDANTGIIQRRGQSGSNQVQYITTNGGETWNALTPTGNFYTASFTFVPGSDLLISTGVDYETPLQGVSYSTDNGTTFTDYAEFYKNYQFTAIGAANENTIWAGSFNSDKNNGGMWHYGNIYKELDFSINNRSFCVSDSSVILTNESIVSPDSLFWDFGIDASPATAIGEGPHTVKYLSEGLKNITLTTFKDAVENVITKNEIVHIASTAPNEAGIITGDTDVMSGETISYSIVNQDNVSFMWELPTLCTGSSFINEINVIFTETGTGTITVTPTNGCGIGISSTLEITVSPYTGIDKVEPSLFTIYPNPAKNSIYISNIINAKVSIYNTAGILVFKKENISSETPIQIANLNNGIYYIHIVDGEKSGTQILSITR